MKNAIKMLFLIGFLGYSSMAMAQSVEYGVVGTNGYNPVSQEEIKALYIETLNLKEVKFGELQLDKMLDEETGETIIFLKTQVYLANGAVLNINNRVYRTADGTFTLNAPKSNKIFFVSCRSKDPAGECIPKLTSNGALCDGGANCEKTSVATDVAPLFK